MPLQTAKLPFGWGQVRDELIFSSALFVVVLAIVLTVAVITAVLVAAIFAIAAVLVLLSVALVLLIVLIVFHKISPYFKPRRVIDECFRLLLYSFKRKV